jgi:hypothetical protein
MSRAKRLPPSRRCRANPHHVALARLSDVSVAAAAMVCREEAA